MGELKSIVILLLKSNYRSAPGEKKGGKIAVYAVFAILYLIMEFAFVAMITEFTPVFVQNELIPELITFILAIGLSAVAALGILPMLSTLYFSSDADFFLSLPVSQGKVYFAKLCTVYITQLGLTALLIAPALIVIGANAMLSALYYVVMTFAIVLLPVFPILISSIICLPLMYLIKFFKNRGAVSSIASLVVFVVFFIFYTFGASSGAAGGEIIDVAKEIIEPVKNVVYYLPPLLAISRFATFEPVFGLEIGVSMILNFAIFVLPIIFLFGLTVLISRKAYFGAVTAQLENHKKATKSSVHQNSRSIFKALILREWKDIIRTPTFALQCFGGLIIAPIFLITMALSGEFELIFSQLGPEIVGDGTGLLWFFVLALLQMFIVSVNIGASTTISRDGASFFVSKLLPVPYKVQLNAKIALYLIVYGAAALICTGIEYIIFGFDFWWMGIMQLVYLLIVNYALIQLYICLDLSSPKLDWKSYREIVKNSRNATLPTLIGIAWAIFSGTAALITYITISTYISAQAASIVAYSIIILIALVIAIVMKCILNKNADKFFERIGG